MGSWREAFENGLVVVTPFLVTLLVLSWLYGVLVALPVFEAVTPAPVRVLVLLVVFTLSAFSVGYLMRTALGSLVDRAIDALFRLVPGLRAVHPAVKRAVKTAVYQRGVGAAKIDLAEGIRISAFRTGRRTDDGRVILFVPGAPDVSSGLVAEVEAEDVTDTDERLGDLLIRQASCGFADVNQRETRFRPPKGR